MATLDDLETLIVGPDEVLIIRGVPTFMHEEVAETLKELGLDGRTLIVSEEIQIGKVTR